MKTLYTATVTATGGRDGKLVSDDNLLIVDVKAPTELGGPGGATNPEQLFAGGYAACFESALNLVCKSKQVKVDKTQVTARVSIGKAEDAGFDLEVELDVLIEGVDEALKQELVEAAHQVCPYSRATRGNISVELNIVQ